jgi:hypothetical protein
MSRFNRYCLGLSLLLVCAGVRAEVAGSHDIDVLPRFTGSTIVSFKNVADQERTYPQGAIRRISGTLRYEREVAARGELTAVTYELPRTHSANEVFASARTTLQDQDAELLYWCVGRDCGSSSLWANSVFNNATLTGSDDEQTYALMRLAAPRQDTLLALYSITRGNKRAYLHAEMFAANAQLGEILPTPATLLRQLKSTGELRLPKQVEPSIAWVELLARSLRLDSTLRVSISGAQAVEWRKELIEQRVRSSRIEVDETDFTGVQLKLLR